MRFRAHSLAVLIGLTAAGLSGCGSVPGRMAGGGEPARSASAETPATLPGKHWKRDAQYVFYSDLPIPANAPLFRELGELRDHVQKELKLPPSTGVIQVYLFEDRDKYERYMAANYRLPNRPAYFIAHPARHGASEELSVFTFWGDNVQQNLRHELTHGLLHASLRDVPLWLDEGLAEYFELPPKNEGVNPSHLEKLLGGEFSPDLARLEGLREVNQMERAEYREAWAWVHLMLRAKPEAKAILIDYLYALRSPGTPPKLLPKLKEAFPDPATSLAVHLNRMQSPKARAQDGGR